MQWHLDEISSQVAPGAHAVLIIDGAGWHTTGNVAPAVVYFGRHTAIIKRREKR